jgi:UDP-N-acetylglucosamine--N-acetylmuramyl-(pentapeptide) pyrophosphoryl-undecaprenol N-acetylglucosamine transferase
MKILLAGGGSGGPVSPLIAVAKEIKKLAPKTEFLFVGTKQGPERQMVEAEELKFVSISAARLRRFFTLKNLLVPFVLIAGFIQARKIIKNFQPQIIFSAGSFVAVPICWAARSKKIRIIIHQQDARIGLANKLISPFASQITTAFEQTSKQFYSGSGLNPKKLTQRAVWVGNPTRMDLLVKNDSAKKFFNLHDKLPILLILGGATGAAQINKIISEILPDLVLAQQVVHQTGKGKNEINFKHPNYHPVELMNFEIYASILQMAHLVIGRAGLSTISELSALHKPAIIIPMPGTHQEENAEILLLTHSAVVLRGTEASPENLAKVINSLKFNQKRIDMLCRNIGNLMPKEADKKLAQIILSNNES